ncbi:MAG: hypothetical protein LBK73_16700 [Treponema sp.]|nr:hypothetical protein [Treponema sp.]
MKKDEKDGGFERSLERSDSAAASTFLRQPVIAKYGGDLQSMMNSGTAKRTKDDAMKNDNHHRRQTPPLPEP